MTFHAINATPGSKREPIVLSVRTNHGRHRIRLTFNADFIRQLGWTIETAMQPFVGDGTDHGLIRLKPATGRGFRMVKISHSTRIAFQFPAPPDCPDTFAACEPEFTIGSFDKSLTIRLPWAQKLRAVG